MPEPITTPTTPPSSVTIDPFNLAGIRAYDEAAPEPEPKPAPPPPPAAPKAPRAVLRQARELGLTDAEIEKLTPEDLADEIYLRSTAAITEARAEAKIAAAQKAKEETEAKLEAYKPDLGGAKLDDVDDQITLALQHLEKRLNQIAAGQQALHENTVRRDAQSAAERLDALFAQDETTFGKGPSSRINPASREGARRAAVVGHLQGLIAQKRATTLEKDFADAVEVFGFGAPAAGKTAEQLEAEQWAKSGLARPTNRQPEELPQGPERAARSLDKMLAAHRDRGGITVNGRAKIEDFPD